LAVGKIGESHIVKRRMKVEKSLQYEYLNCFLNFNLQLVWGASNELGMAKAKTRDSSNVYVVARYKPAGNVVNQFQSNVKPKQ